MFAEIVVSNPPVIVGIRILGMNFNRFGIIRDRTHFFSEILVSIPPVLVGNSQLGINLDRFIPIG